MEILFVGKFRLVNQEFVSGEFSVICRNVNWGKITMQIWFHCDDRKLVQSNNRIISPDPLYQGLLKPVDFFALLQWKVSTFEQTPSSSSRWIKYCEPLVKTPVEIRENKWGLMQKNFLTANTDREGQLEAGLLLSRTGVCFLGKKVKTIILKFKAEAKVEPFVFKTVSRVWNHHCIHSSSFCFIFFFFELPHRFKFASASILTFELDEKTKQSNWKAFSYVFLKLRSSQRCLEATLASQIKLQSLFRLTNNISLSS